MYIPNTGQLLLQQSDFQSNIVGSFQDLRFSGEFLDVTLACDDETVEAHKVVISACSPFFRHILSKAKQAHPFIYLKGILHQDLLALLDYMYNGATKVAAEDVNRFIEAAKELKIKGLAPDKVNEREDQQIVAASGEADKEEPIGDATDVNTQLDIEISRRIMKIRGEDGKQVWECTECGKIGKFKNHLKSHVESHLEGFVHKCDLCEKDFKTRNTLNNHKSMKHRENREATDETNNTFIEFPGTKEDEDMSNLDESEFPLASDEENEKENKQIFAASGGVEEPISDETDVETRIDIEISQRMVKIRGDDGKQVWKCTECGKIGKFKTHLRSHVETHLEGFVHKCEFCKKEFKTRNSLNSHKSSKHLDIGVAMNETKDTQTLIKGEIEFSGAKEELLNWKPQEDKDMSNLNESEFSNNETICDEPCENDSIDTNGKMMEKLTSEISKRTEYEGSMWKCTECGKVCKRKDRLRLHIETHHKSIEQLDKGVAMDETKDKQTLIKSEIETFGAQEELLNSKTPQDEDRSNLNESEFLNNETSFDEPV